MWVVTVRDCVTGNTITSYGVTTWTQALTDVTLIANALSVLDYKCVEMPAEVFRCVKVVEDKSLCREVYAYRERES